MVSLVAAILIIVTDMILLCTGLEELAFSNHVSAQWVAEITQNWEFGLRIDFTSNLEKDMYSCFLSVDCMTLTYMVQTTNKEDAGIHEASCNT